MLKLGVWNYKRFIGPIAYLIIFGLFLAVGWWRLDPDFGWHLTAGGYIRAHGIPAHDIYSYTAPNFRWIDHEWGNDVILSWLYQWGGYLLAAIVFAAAWTTALFLAGRKVGWITALLAALALLPYAGIRPMVWSLLGLAVLFRLTVSKNPRARYFIPLLFIIWANLHAGFVIGLAYLAYLAITKRSRPWLLMLVICLPLTFINPYGPRLYVEIFRTLMDRSLHSQVTEWEPFNILLPSWPFIVAWLCGFWLFSKKKWRDWLGFDSLLLVAGFSASRNIAMFVIAGLANTDAYLRQAYSRLPKNLDLSRRLVVAGFAAGAVFAIVLSLKYTFWPFNPRESSFPQQAVAYLQAHPCSGNLFNDYNYGGYLIWKLPAEPVYIDGRMPSWKAPDGVKYLDTYFQIISTPATRNQQFSRYNIRCALLRDNSDELKMAEQLQKAGWSQKVNANGSVLLIKNT